VASRSNPTGIVVQHMYGHHKHRSYIDTHQFPPSRCKLFKYNRVSNNNVHGVFIKVQYPWLSYYGGQQEYNIRSNVRSLPISWVQVYRSTGVQEYQISGNNRIVMPSPCKSDSHEYVIYRVLGSGVRYDIYQVPGLYIECRCKHRVPES